LLAGTLKLMPKRSSKPPKDENSLAAFIVAKSTDEAPHEKNPAAVALGRLGGLKGGRARAAKLSSKRRSQIAKDAARARWKKPTA
jgi:hypothetical protein